MSVSKVLTFHNQLKRSFSAEEPHCHIALVAARVWVSHLGKLGLFVQFNIILNEKKIISALWITNLSPLISIFSIKDPTFVHETFVVSEASIWRVRSKVSPALLMIFPKGLKLMSRSEKRGEDGEKMLRRPDKGRNIPFQRQCGWHNFFLHKAQQDR